MTFAVPRSIPIFMTALNATPGDAVARAGGPARMVIGMERRATAGPSSPGGQAMSAERVMLAPSCWNLRSMFSYPR
jgi:hypothetical protein